MDEETSNQVATMDEETAIEYALQFSKDAKELELEFGIEIQITPEEILLISQQMEKALIFIENCASTWERSAPTIAGWKRKRIEIIERLDAMPAEIRKIYSNVREENSSPSPDELGQDETNSSPSPDELGQDETNSSPAPDELGQDETNSSPAPDELGQDKMSKDKTGSLNSTHAALLGGGVALAGLISAPFTLGIGANLFLVGIGVSIVSIVTKTVMVRNKIAGLNDLLREHQEDSECLQEWFTNATNFMGCVNEIIDISIFDHMLKAIKLFFADMTSRKNFMKSVLRFLLQSPLDSSEMHEKKSELFKVALLLVALPNACTAACRIIEMCQTNPYLFEAINMASEVGIQVFCALNVGSNSISTIYSVTRTSTGTSAHVISKTVASSIFQGIELAIYTSCIPNMSRESRQGSLSEFMKKIQEARDKLQRGLNLMACLDESSFALIPVHQRVASPNGNSEIFSPEQLEPEQPEPDGETQHLVLVARRRTSSSPAVRQQH